MWPLNSLTFPFSEAQQNQLSNDRASNNDDDYDEDEDLPNLDNPLEDQDQDP